VEVFLKFIAKVSEFFTYSNMLSILESNWKMLLGVDTTHLLLAFLTILPWGFVIYYFQPTGRVRKLLIILGAFILGILSTKLILTLHPVLWPEVNFKPKRTTVLSQTVYIAFVQAGMLEETFKILLILLFSYFVAFDRKLKLWKKDVILIGAFVALGFAFVENYVYIHKDNNPKVVMNMFIGRAVFSSNIHLLINICFALFLFKSNFEETKGEKFILVLYGYFLAILQHGIVDFFLLPSSRFGTWLASAFFVGIWVWVARDLRKYIYGYEIEVLEDIPKLEDSLTTPPEEELYQKYMPPPETENP
jgi:RsiW-degrading membrane proteinase PrsW (M82 family)